jgi:hypothetical protein
VWYGTILLGRLTRLEALHLREVELKHLIFFLPTSSIFDLIIIGNKGGKAKLNFTKKNNKNILSKFIVTYSVAFSFLF